MKKAITFLSKITFLSLSMGFFLSQGNVYAQPANDNCSASTLLTVGSSCVGVSGTTFEATGSTVPLSDCSGSTTDDDVWYSFVATATSHLVTLSNINEDMVLSVYGGSCGSLVELDCADDPEQIILAGLTVGATYYCRVWTYSAGDEGDFDICVTDAPIAPINDECSGATVISGVTGIVTGNSLVATESLADCAFSFEDANDVWYTVTTDNPGDIILTASSNFIDVVMQVFSGTCTSLNALSCVDNTSTTETFTISNATANSTYYVRVYDYYGSGGEFTIQTGGSALPVKMDKLEGKITTGNLAQLNWNTLAEQNNKGFEIQRSIDGKNFNIVGFVGSKANGGNSNEKIAYSFTDRDKVNGSVYYRLQQTDIDGKTALSNVVRLSTKENGGFEVVAAPNPVRNAVSVKTYGVQASNATITVTDVTGKVMRRSAATSNETIIDMNNFAQGIYLIKYTDAEHNETIKVSKQ